MSAAAEELGKPAADVLSILRKTNCEYMLPVAQFIAWSLYVTPLLYM